MTEASTGHMHEQVQMLFVAAGGVGFPCPDAGELKSIIPSELGELVSPLSSGVDPLDWRLTVDVVCSDGDETVHWFADVSGEIPCRFQLTDCVGSNAARNPPTPNLALRGPLRPIDVSLVINSREW
ncbi:hypothetical protein [Bradyrhizobium sp. CB3481]|uniref:hypothetical protein n=1 Tax=Bradyrhizobium sp. CB3481 TaxID=3039158 RepID=UPI0024B119B9|nr:hypothetical protein [Bradyrhizobium sp. CB3481]WFU14453.1 hypothetical protein QA643_25095 [Bradyrhizobium sp. CB3481]